MTDYIKNEFDEITRMINEDEVLNEVQTTEENQIEEPVQEPEVQAEEPVQEPEQCTGGECNLDKKSTEELGMEELDKMGEVDQIRKITLNGMTKLADHPEDPQFQALLKIFQICNKSVDTKEEGGEK